MSADPPGLADLLQHRAFLERFARSLARDASVAEDVVQETWLVALERPPRHHGNPRAWLQRVARNVFLQRQRSRTIAPPLESLSSEPEEDPGAAREREAISHALGTELLALPEPYRRVLILHFYEDKTPAEIARDTGRPVNTVSSQIRRGLKLMEERLDRADPGGREHWLRALLCLLPRSAPGGSGPGGNAPASAPLVRSTVGARAMAWLGVVAAAVALFVLVLSLRIPARAAGAEPDGSEVARSVVTPNPLAPLDAREPDGTDAAAARLPVPLAPQRDAASAANVVARLQVEVVATDGSPVEGANVQTSRDALTPGASTKMNIFDGVNFTAANGRVEVPLTAENRVRFGMDGVEMLGVVVQAVGFMTSDAHCMPFPVGDTASITIRLERSSVSIRGKVTDAEGRPLQGAWVEIGRSRQNRIDLANGRFLLKSAIMKPTDAGGRYEHLGVPSGTNEVWVECAGFVAHLGTLTLSDPSETVYDVVLDRGATVTGRVNTADGLAAPGARVWVEAHPKGPKPVIQQTLSGSDGTYELQGVPQGATWLIAEHATLTGHAATLFATLVTGERRTWNPVLREQPPLLLRILRDDGSPIAGALISLQAKQERGAWQRFLAAGPDGRLRVDAVPASEVTASVFLSPADLDNGVPPCFSEPGLRCGPDEKALIVPRESTGRGGLRGLLLDYDGKPFANAVLQLRRPEDQYFYPTPAAPATGAFLNDRLTTQSYELIAWAEGFGTMRIEEFEVLAGEVFDLGEIRLPRPIPWSATWPHPEAVDGDAYELIKVDGTGKLEKSWMIASGAGPPPPSFALFPGRYDWLVYREGKLLREDVVDVR